MCDHGPMECKEEIKESNPKVISVGSTVTSSLLFEWCSV